MWRWKIAAAIPYNSATSCNNKIPQTEQKLREAEIFIKCLKLGNEELILQYDDNMYLQKRGLAMGVADSPDLANLYGWMDGGSKEILT